MSNQKKAEEVERGCSEMVQMKGIVNLTSFVRNPKNNGQLEKSNEQSDKQKGKENKQSLQVVSGGKQHQRYRLSQQRSSQQTPQLFQILQQNTSNCDGDQSSKKEFVFKRPQFGSSFLSVQKNIQK
eukprot:TRINITY_DN16324_c1_g1_i1.p5 TRINITY_DN16324_c1_g1~~TRINITY_DN16324_c1_g1_i1.p5  ORF type:complete len:126 (+),score=16.66 TRINITY_DN16324_c1_g1_i1:213-590(+)